MEVDTAPPAPAEPLSVEVGSTDVIESPAITTPVTPADGDAEGQQMKAEPASRRTRRQTLGRTGKLKAQDEPPAASPAEKKRALAEVPAEDEPGEPDLALSRFF